MANTTDVASAIRELTSTKQLERSDLLELLKDGLHAALVKRYGPNVRAEIGIDELKGTIKIVLLRTVVETGEERLPGVAGGGAVRGFRLPGRRRARGGGAVRDVRPHGGAGGEATHHPAGARGGTVPHP